VKFLLLGSSSLDLLDQAVDLVVKQGSRLRAFELKWSSGRVSGRAFRDAYGVDVEPIRSDNPFAAEITMEM